MTVRQFLIFLMHVIEGFCIGYFVYRFGPAFGICLFVLLLAGQFRNELHRRN